MNGSQEQGEQERKKPTLIAYSVKLNEDQAIWTRIGAAWAHKKGPDFRSSSMPCRWRAGSCWWRRPWTPRRQRMRLEAAEENRRAT
jgi:hypothetical protein